MKVTDIVAKIAEPVVKQHGCELWDVEYVREGDQRFLRIYLDKETGVDINDCEAISRAMDPLLDEADPIAESYHFEVCSAGLERALKRPGDFEAFMGSPISSETTSPPNFCFNSIVSKLEIIVCDIPVVYELTIKNKGLSLRSSVVLETRL